MTRAWELAGRELSGSASRDELAEWQLLKAADPELDYYSTLFTQLWEQADNNQEEIAAAWERLKRLINEQGDF